MVPKEGCWRALFMLQKIWSYLGSLKKVSLTGDLVIPKEVLQFQKKLAFIVYNIQLNLEILSVVIFWKI